jgi:hypothetical protein
MPCTEHDHQGKDLMPSIRRLFCALLVCSALAAVTAGPALASHGQMVFFEAPSDLLNPSLRDPAIAKLKALGVHALRVQLYWQSVAPSPNSSRRPNFDATNPASYNWGAWDPLLADAKALHWPVLLTVTSPVPKWATAGHRDTVTRPDDLQFQQFMTAVGRHYGSEVALYAIWNEPDHWRFLRPQWNANGTPASPRIYRGLFQAGYAGLKAAGIANPKVLMGETAPGGETVINARHGVLKLVAPLVFLRGALCLNTSYVMSRSCSMLPAYGYGHHAYTNASGPFYNPPGQENVTIGVLSRLTRALDRAAGARAIRGHMPIYLTEFGIQSTPSSLGVPFAQQAEFDAIAERIAFENPRVASFSQYLLRDDPLGTRGTVGFQTGLETVRGAAKPLYFGFPLPLTVSKRGHGFALWGLVRPATGATSVTVLVEQRGSHRFRTLKTLTTNGAGYWALSSSTQGSRWRVQWRGPNGILHTGPPIRAY